MCIVIIIGSDAIYLFSASQHIVIAPSVVLVVTVKHTAVICDFHGMHIVVVHIVGIILKGPCRMIVGDEEAHISSFFHHLAYAFSAVAAFKIGFDFIKEHHISVLGAFSENIFAPVPAWAQVHCRVKRNITNVRSLLFAQPVRIVFVTGIQLYPVHRDKFIVSQLVVGYEHIVIRKGNDAVAVRHIKLLNLRRSFVTV